MFSERIPIKIPIALQVDSTKLQSLLNVMQDVNLKGSNFNEKTQTMDITFDNETVNVQCSHLLLVVLPQLLFKGNRHFTSMYLKCVTKTFGYKEKHPNVTVKRWTRYIPMAPGFTEVSEDDARDFLKDRYFKHKGYAVKEIVQLYEYYCKVIKKKIIKF